MPRVILQLGSDINFQNFCDDWYSVMEFNDLESIEKDDMANRIYMDDNDFDLWSNDIEGIVAEHGGDISFER